MQTTFEGGFSMARKNRKFSGTSMARYSAKVGKMMKAVSADDATAMNMTNTAVYHFAIGQGGYHVLRDNISKVLDKKGVPKPARVPFYAMVQYIYKRITKDGVKPEDLLREKNTILDKYFTKGTSAYKIAEEILNGMLKTSKTATGATKATNPATTAGGA